MLIDISPEPSRLLVIDADESANGTLKSKAAGMSSIDQTYHFKVNRHTSIVGVLRELVGCPFIHSILFCEVK